MDNESGYIFGPVKVSNFFVAIVPLTFERARIVKFKGDGRRGYDDGW